MPSDNEPYYDDDEHICIQKNITKKCDNDNCCKDDKFDCEKQSEKK